MLRDLSRAWRQWRFLTPWLALVLSAFILTAIRTQAQIAPAQRDVRDAGPARHVGSQACTTCHASQSAAWAGSHHAHAMDHARPSSMRGDFADRTVEEAGRRARFFRDGEVYRVNIEGADGRPADFTISHSLGWEPLQQYLVTFPDGRLQVLPWAWDTRSAAEGGQRWFLVSGAEAIAPSDSRHWTRLQQNWNHMCAECHTTDLRKGYDARADRFETRWSELAVGCEACHGPAGLHVSWARSGASAADPLKGFAAVAPAGPARHWTPATAETRPAVTTGRPAGDSVETCARCHSRRGQIAVDWRPGRPLTETHSPVPLAAGLFEHDGQMKDEVFNDHSFKQSLMYHRGVSCTDCHDPHSGRLKAAGAAVCSLCHAPARFQTAAHSGHADRAGAPDCISCHMPARTYMQVDRRHDHSFRIPRPDLTIATGVPNTCQSCHGDRTALWAAEAVERWHGPVRKGFQTYATAFHEARAGEPSGRDALLRLAVDPAAPALARATAIGELAAWPGAQTDAVGLRALDDPDPQVRAAAIRQLEGLPRERRLVAAPLLDDPSRLVRVAAGFLLADLPVELLPPKLQPALAEAVAAYVAAQELDLDRPEARANRAQLHLKQVRAEEAERDYRAALRLDPSAGLIAAQFAELLRRTGREDQAEAMLRSVLAVDPRSGAALHALGLSLVRQKRLPEALGSLAQASEAEPGNPRYAFVHAVALRSAGRAQQARSVLEENLARHPGHVDTAVALLQEALQNRDHGRAAQLAKRLTALRPDDRRFEGISRDLNR